MLVHRYAVLKVQSTFSSLKGSKIGITLEGVSVSSMVPRNH
jgi:hypothetical protein